MPEAQPAAAGAAGPRADASFAALAAALRSKDKRDSLARQFDGAVAFDLGDAGRWVLNLRASAGDAAGVRKIAGGAQPDVPPDLTLLLSEDVFVKLVKGELEPTTALVNGARRDARRAAPRRSPR